MGFKSFGIRSTVGHVVGGQQGNLINRQLDAIRKTQKRAPPNLISASRKRQIDRQADRQARDASIHAGTQAGRQAGRHTGRNAGRQASGYACMHASDICT